MILIIVGVRVLRVIRLVGMKIPIVTTIKFGQTKLMRIIKAMMLRKKSCPKIMKYLREKLFQIYLKIFKRKSIMSLGYMIYTVSLQSKSIEGIEKKLDQLIKLTEQNEQELKRIKMRSRT